MTRVEFATFDAAVARPPPARPAADSGPTAPLPAALPAAKEHITFAEAPVRVLLVAEDTKTAEAVSGILSDCFGRHVIRDWTSDASDAAERMQEKRHDIYIVAGCDNPAFEALLGLECEAPIIAIGADTDGDADIRAIAAGASEHIDLSRVSAPLLMQAIRHAVIRQQRETDARQRIDALTAERARLNRLREANHRFVENACHDFRSPLTVIKEFASIIAEGLAGDVNGEQAEFLEIILTRVDQLSQMVDGILDASRLESDAIGVRREEQPVDKLIAHARPTLEQRAAAHKVDIEFAIPDDLPQVFADTESIGRVIVNLGANACKFAGEHGKVRIWARHDPERREVTIGVTDSGPGIAPEHVKMIFDRFQQIPGDKEKGKDGFGLGLHIATELVRVNFGTLSVESEPKNGSTFAFTLPTFDVNALIPLHFDFLRTARHGFQKVSIAMANVDGTAADATLAESERTLTRQLRSYDLMLRVSRGGWLICAAGDSDDLGKIIERIQGTYSEINRNRPEGRLPEVRFRTVGTWSLSSQAEGLKDAIRGAAGLVAEAQQAN